MTERILTPNEKAFQKAAAVLGVSVKELKKAFKKQAQNEVPLCDGHADSWFTGRNHLKGDHRCVVCAHAPSWEVVAARSESEPTFEWIIERLDGHYWDSLSQHKALILQHVAGALQTPKAPPLFTGEDGRYEGIRTPDKQDRILKIAEEQYGEELGYAAIVNFLHDPEVEAILSAPSATRQTFTEEIAQLRQRAAEMDAEADRFERENVYSAQGLSRDWLRLMAAQISAVARILELGALSDGKGDSNAS